MSSVILDRLQNTTKEKMMFAPALRNRCCGIGLFILALVTFLSWAPGASAAEEITTFDGRSVADESGTPYTQAGGHPYEVGTVTRFRSELDPETGKEVPLEDLKTVVAELPLGLVGNPGAVQQCNEADLNTTVASLCPPSTQVGYIIVNSRQFDFPLLVGVFNMEPPVGKPAAFGFNIVGTVVHISASVRQGDYGLNLEFPNTAQTVQISAANLVFWGVPGDPSHDQLRAAAGTPISCGVVSLTDPTPIFCLGTNGAAGDRSGGAFLTLPTNCAAGPLTITARADSWQTPGVFDEASWTTHLPPYYPAEPDEYGPPQGATDCDRVPFQPRLTVEPRTSAAASPTGLHVELSIPSEGLENPGGLSQAHLKDVEVEFPEGMTVNPASAAGLQACSKAQFAAETATSVPGSGCPSSSKLGSVSIETPLLEQPLEGPVYLAAPRSGNQFDSLIALYIVARSSERGVVVKLPGRVATDPATGRLTATFEDNPQLPFSSLKLDLFGGPRASLVTPSKCGSFETVARLSPWSAVDPENPTPAEIVTSGSSFEITSGPGGSPCSQESFDPEVTIGTVNPVAGIHSPLTVEVSRRDGSAHLGSIEATLPEGLLASLKGVPYCPESALASVSDAEGSAFSQVTNPSCPPASQVGSVSVRAGVGGSPFHLDTGKVYLAGPYKGGPLSLAIVTPAIAGPFDLGSVLVRSAIRVDPATARITAVSDPLPQILHGIPLELRDVRVNIDRPSFTLNPTSCNPMDVGSVITSIAGQSITRSSRFQVGSCEALAFRPKLSLKFSGPTHRSAHPALKATLKMPKGGANIRKAVVTLPETEFLENAHIRTICTRVQYAADNCPKGSIYGYAKAWTPLLDKPLQGPVYLRSSNHTLPDLVASLDGQIHIDLAGRIDSRGGRIRNTFWAVPDAPVSKFVLTMQGGKKGLLANNEELCRAKPRAKAEFTGQNGKRSVSRPLVRADCKR